MTLIVSLASAAACTASSSSGHRSAGRALGPATSEASAETTPTDASSDSQSLAPTALSSVFARAQGEQVDVYASASSFQTVQRLPSPNRDGSPAVFLLTGSHSHDRVQVQLPERPNGSTGWLDRTQIDLYTNPYRLVVQVGAHRLQEFDAGQLVETDPVGIGRGVTPTPTGTYYLTELLQPPNVNGVYGPYAYGLSAYSPVLTDFAGGPGQIGLHGTNDPAGVGTDVSHGCIRVANGVITRLAHNVPPGTPISIDQ